MTCRLLRVDVDTAAFTPGGDVAVALSCAVAFGDLALLRLPGAQTLHARAVAVLDRYRSAG